MLTFNKTERLRSKKIIERLFNQGDTFINYPFKIVWLKTSLKGPFPAQVLISVSKKGFKRAVDRNKIKRRIREAYRKNKHILYGHLGKTSNSCALAIIFIGKEIYKYNDIERKIIDSLTRFIEHNEKNYK